MTPAISILCAVLAVIAGLGIRATFIYWRQVNLFHNQILVLRETREELMAQAEKDAALLAEARSLLHDTAARGKDGRWIPWSERRAAWVKKCEVRG